jgi:hypothetical protein
MLSSRFVFASAAVVFAAGPAFAGITVFDSKSTYEMWAQLRGDVALAQEDFSSVTAGATSGSLVGKVGTEAEWLASATGGLQTSSGLLQTVATGKAMTIDFSSNRVYGIGANFLYTTGAGLPVSGYVILGLSDGTQYVRGVSGVDTFAGFWSDGAAITRLTITPFGSAGAASYLGARNMDIGFAPAVPAPGAAALLALATFGSRRRRM